MEFITGERQLGELTIRDAEHKRESSLRSIPGFQLLDRVKVSQNSRCQAVLARAVNHWLDDSARTYLKVEEWGIWPTEEDPLIVELLLKGLGINANYRDYREFAFEFKSDERELSRSFFRLALSFGWGGVLVGERKELAVLFSHDEWVQLGGQDIGRLNHLQRQLQEIIEPFRQ
jgi:hypothetical protein